MARILVVSRQIDEGRSLARLLRRDGHKTYTARSDSAAQRTLFAHRPEMLVLSLPDPTSTMRSLGRAVGSSIRSTPAIAVVREDEKDEIDRDVPGLMDLLATPFSDESFLGHIDALLRVRKVLYDRIDLRQSTDPDASSTQEAARAGRFKRLIALLAEVGRTPIRRKSRPLEPYLETAASIVGTIEGRDSIDPGHALRVSAHCASIAKFLGMSEEETDHLLYAASVHDIGKIALSRELLSKPSLTDSDRKVMRFHPRRGAELIRALTPYTEAADVVLYHHERPDGQGYYGRPGAEVPRLARVLAVADVFDGMTSSRSDRAPLTPEAAVEALREGRGAFYDGDCVDALASAVRPRRRSVPVSPPPDPHGR